MARRRFSVHNLVRAKPPLNPEQIANWWVNKNLDTIAEVAMNSMLDPPGSCYTVHPLRITAFQSSDSRISYQLSLHHAAETRGSTHVVADAIMETAADPAAPAGDGVSAGAAHETAGARGMGAN